MRTLIIAVIFFVFANCFSQDKEEYSRWNLSVNGGLVYFMNGYAYHQFIEGYYNDIYKSTSIGVLSDWSINHYECTAGYFFNQYHEVGLTLGRGAFTLPGKILGVYSFRSGDTNVALTNKQRAYTSEWWGIFYNFHYKDYFYAGIKLASADDTYECFLVGKKFNLKNSFFIKTEISYSFLNSDYIWNFSSARSEKITLSFGLGLNL